METLKKLCLNEDGVAHKLLRRATHEYHVRLNHHPMLVGLTQPGYSLVRYQNLLFAYFYIYQVLEVEITRYLEFQEYSFDYASRLKLPWLSKSIGFFCDNFVPKYSPNRPLALPVIKNVGQLIGALYVVEGATLGGQHILKSLSNQYSLSSSDGFRFFQGYGDQTPYNWQEFLHFSNSISGHVDYCSAAVESAVLVFQLFENVLDDYAQLECY